MGTLLLVRTSGLSVTQGRLSALGPMCGRGGLMSWWKGNNTAAVESPSPEYAAPAASPFAPEHNAEENYPTTSGGAFPTQCTARLQHTCNRDGCHG